MKSLNNHFANSQLSYTQILSIFISSPLVIVLISKGFNITNFPLLNHFDLLLWSEEKPCRVRNCPHSSFKKLHNRLEYHCTFHFAPYLFPLNFLKLSPLIMLPPFNFINFTLICTFLFYSPHENFVIINLNTSWIYSTSNINCNF